MIVLDGEWEGFEQRLVEAAEEHFVLGDLPEPPEPVSFDQSVVLPFAA